MIRFKLLLYFIFLLSWKSVISFFIIKRYLHKFDYHFFFLYENLELLLKFKIFIFRLGKKFHFLRINNHNQIFSLTIISDYIIWFPIIFFLFFCPSFYYLFLFLSYIEKSEIKKGLLQSKQLHQMQNINI